MNRICNRDFRLRIGLREEGKKRKRRENRGECGRVGM